MAGVDVRHRCTVAKRASVMIWLTVRSLDIAEVAGAPGIVPDIQIVQHSSRVEGLTMQVSHLHEYPYCYCYQ